MRLASWIIAAVMFNAPAQAVASDNPAIEAMQEYMDFANYEAGIIVPEQLSQEVFESILFIDTRDEGQYKAGTIPGAVNIEWRQVLARRDEIPADRKVVLFCNTGSLSAQAAFALRVAGLDNVLVLQTGLSGWAENAPYMPK
jgi:rhodanese-related sulfurtransferase